MDKSRAISLHSNQTLRDCLDLRNAKPLSSFVVATPLQISKTVNELLEDVDILMEVVRRLWDEFEGHQDLCRRQSHVDEEMKKFIQGFGYKKLEEIEKLPPIPCPWIDNDADDGWGASLDSLAKTIEQARNETMDKQIKKVEKDVKKGKKVKAVKDIKVLKKMDKKFDKKIDKAKKVMKKGC